MIPLDNDQYLIPNSQPAYLSMERKSETSLGTSVFGLSFDFKTRNNDFDSGRGCGCVCRGGGVKFSL